MKPSEPTPCSGCGGPLTMRRIDDLHIVEYRARCLGCGWSDPLRELRCGGCHGLQVFEWTSESWRCIRCGHVLRDRSPPRDLGIGG